MAAVGRGVEVLRSRLPNAGNGLFATRPFARGDVVTTYEGETDTANVRKDAAGNYDKTYAIDHCDTGETIYGVTDVERLRALGLGGGSFVNDALGAHPYNARFRGNADGTIDVVALCDIAPLDEVYVSYGYSYWYSRLLTSPALYFRSLEVELRRRGAAFVDDHGAGGGALPPSAVVAAERVRDLRCLAWRTRRRKDTRASRRCLVELLAARRRARA